MTNFVILKRVPMANAEVWEQVTAQYAASRKAAVNAVVGQLGPGSYRAIPVVAWGREDVRT